MKKLFVLAALAEMFVAAFLFRTNIGNFLLTHLLWQSLLAAFPGAALVILGLWDLLGSGGTDNAQQQVSDLQRQNNELKEKLEGERNEHLQEISGKPPKTLTPAERSANLLQKHLGKNVSVSEVDGDWGSLAQVAEISKDNILSLFTPRSQSSSMAWFAKVRCEDVEISEAPGHPLRLKVLKRYGPEVPLGDITKWEDRLRESAMPIFTKGKTAYYAGYDKLDSSDKRSVMISASADETNSFLLEASTGQLVVGDNEEISKRYMVIHIEYQAAGFIRNTETKDAAAHKLFI